MSILRSDRNRPHAGFGTQTRGLAKLEWNPIQKPSWTHTKTTYVGSYRSSTPAVCLEFMLYLFVVLTRSLYLRGTATRTTLAHDEIDICLTGFGIWKLPGLGTTASCELRKCNASADTETFPPKCFYSTALFLLYLCAATKGTVSKTTAAAITAPAKAWAFRK